MTSEEAKKKLEKIKSRMRSTQRLNTERLKEAVATSAGSGSYDPKSYSELDNMKDMLTSLSSDPFERGFALGRFGAHMAETEFQEDGETP